MWPKYQTSIIVSAGLATLLSMFWFVQSLALVVFISILLTILLNDMVERLFKHRVPRALAAAIVLISFITLNTLLVITLSRTFIPSLASFIADIPSMTEGLKNLPFFQLSAPITNQLETYFRSLATFSMSALKSSLELIINIFDKFLNLIIILFVTFYMLKDGRQIKLYLANLFPRRDNLRIIELFNKIIHALSSYIRGQLTICLITGILVFAYFTIRDISYASVFAVLSAIAEFIPVVGPTVAALLGVSYCLSQSPILSVETLLFYSVMTQINHNVVYPYLIGKSLSLHPIAVMLGILLGGEVLGAIGMFLAVPFMVIIKLVIEDIIRSNNALH